MKTTVAFPPGRPGALTGRGECAGTSQPKVAGCGSAATFGIHPQLPARPVYDLSPPLRLERSLVVTAGPTGLDQFQQRLPAEFPRLDQEGVNYSKGGSE